MTTGQCSSPYLGLALLILIAQHSLRSPMPASYAPRYLHMRNEFTPWAWQSCAFMSSQTGPVCTCPQRGSRRQKHSCKREVQFHVAVSLFSQSQSARRRNQSGTRASGTWTQTTRNISAQMCDWHALVLAQFGNKIRSYTCTCEPQASLRSNIVMWQESKTANAFQAWVKPSGAGSPWNGWST